MDEPPKKNPNINTTKIVLIVLCSPCKHVSIQLLKYICKVLWVNKKH